jgi:hypothetical protein
MVPAHTLGGGPRLDAPVVMPSYPLLNVSPICLCPLLALNFHISTITAQMSVRSLLLRCQLNSCSSAT